MKESKNAFSPLFRLFISARNVVVLMNNVKSLQEAIEYFSDEQVCIDALAALRWPDGEPVCPHCGLIDSHCYMKTQKRWKCKECRKQFSVKVGTVMEDSPDSA